MSALALQSLIGAALTDTNFRLALLNGSRQRVLQGFPLSPEEIQTLMAIRADTLEQFASQAHQLLIGDAAEPQPLPKLRTPRRVSAPEVHEKAGEPLGHPLTLAVAEYVR
jgi:hypothetical protein